MPQTVKSTVHLLKGVKILQLFKVFAKMLVWLSPKPLIVFVELEVLPTIKFSVKQEKHARIL